MSQEQVEGGDKVLLLGDQHEYIRRLRAVMEQHGHATAVLPSLEPGYAVVINKALALIWIARRGEATVERIREVRNCAIRTPIILVLAGGTLDERCSFRDSGADACLDQNEDPREVASVTVARVRQNQRAGGQVFGGGLFRLDTARRRVTAQGIPIRWVELSKKEFELVELLVENFGRTCSKKAVHDMLWGPRFIPDERRTKKLVERVRGKLETVGGLDLETVHRKGYRLLVAASVYGQ